MSSRRTRILVIEDDTGIRHMLSLALEDAGHEVVVHDGRGPVAVGDADLVVMDVRLGDRTAHDVLRAQPELADRPLVFMTAGSPGGKLHALPTGVVLRKPFDLVALERAIGEALGSTMATADAAGTTGPGPGAER